MNIFKQQLLRFFIRFLSHESVVKKLNAVINESKQTPCQEPNIPNPYRADNSSLNTPKTTSQPVFITGRFRSGSTLLWNIFRNLKHCTAYYEPFNERQWFNSSFRGNRVDTTHLGVTDYWLEYKNMEDLSLFYNEDWIRSRLHMDNTSWDPHMKAYIDRLIQGSQGQAILQFNRVDFRLAWLRQQYPEAKIIHLYRNPRDQFLSFLSDKKLMNKNDIQNTYIDGFYLDIWCNDLQKFYPFLSSTYSPHPYQRFYYLWKLSYLCGKSYANVSISFEDLITKPEDTLQNVFTHINRTDVNWQEILSVIEKPPLDKWKNYAEDVWFSEIEDECEQVLTTYLTPFKPIEKHL